MEKRNRQGRQRGNRRKSWTVRHGAQTTWQREGISLGFKYRGKQLCESGAVTGGRATDALV